MSFGETILSIIVSYVIFAFNNELPLTGAILTKLEYKLFFFTY